MSVEVIVTSGEELQKILDLRAEFPLKRINCMKISGIVMAVLSFVLLCAIGVLSVLFFHETFFGIILSTLLSMLTTGVFLMSCSLIKRAYLIHKESRAWAPILLWMSIPA